MIDVTLALGVLAVGVAVGCGIGRRIRRRTLVRSGDAVAVLRDEARRYAGWSLNAKCAGSSGLNGCAAKYQFTADVLELTASRIEGKAGEKEEKSSR